MKVSLHVNGKAEEIDVAGATMIVRAGTPLEQAQPAAPGAGFMLASRPRGGGFGVFPPRRKHRIPPVQGLPSSYDYRPGP